MIGKKAGFTCFDLHRSMLAHTNTKRGEKYFDIVRNLMFKTRFYFHILYSELSHPRTTYDFDRKAR